MKPVFLGDHTDVYFHVGNGFDAYIDASACGTSTTRTAGSESYFSIVNITPEDTTPTNRIETDWITSGDRAGTPPDPPSPDGEDFKNNYGTFLLDSYASVNPTGTGVLYCSGDSNEHTNGVDWFRQTQEWIFKDNWK